MRHKKLALTLPLVASVLAFIATAATPRATAGDLPAEGDIKPVEVVRTNDYSEGVVIDHQGNLYFSHEKIVTRVTADGKATTWAATGSPNGHKILADGTHLICDASRHALLHLNADGHFLEPAATESDGNPLRGPNDLTLDPSSGGVYFTDPASSDLQTPDGTVHFLDPQKKCHTVAGGWRFPMGSSSGPGARNSLSARANEIASSFSPCSNRGSWANTTC